MSEVEREAGQTREGDGRVDQEIDRNGDQQSWGHEGDCKPMVEILSAPGQEIDPEVPTGFGLVSKTSWFRLPEKNMR